MGLRGFRYVLGSTPMQYNPVSAIVPARRFGREHGDAVVIDPFCNDAVLVKHEPVPPIRGHQPEAGTRGEDPVEERGVHLEFKKLELRRVSLL